MQSDEFPVTLTVTQAAAILGISRGLAYQSAHRFLQTAGADGLPVVRLGRRLLVPTLQLRRLLLDGLGAGAEVEWLVPAATPSRREAGPTSESAISAQHRRRPPVEPVAPVQLSLLPPDGQA